MKINMRAIITLIIIIAVIVYFWHSSALLPLKWLVVFFHEASHALATVLTGGKVISLQIAPDQSGRVISLGGNRFIILSAGYLGSLLCGLVLFLISVYSKNDRWLTAGLGLILLAITLYYADTLFSQIFGGITGLLLCLCAYWLPVSFNDLVCRVIGLSNMLYAPMDIYDDTIARSHLHSDAYMLAQEFGGHTLLWGGLWLLISLVLISACVFITVRKAIHARR